jgi:hypothetical protein
MSIMEFIHSKANHLIIAIIVINIMVWGGLYLFRPASSVAPVKVESVQIQRDTSIHLNTRSRMIRTSPVPPPPPVVVQQPVTISTLEFIFDKWPIIFTIFSSIPVIILKWAKMLDGLKKAHTHVTRKKP